ncbi:hypothetical protein [Streptomyces sp. NBC_00370]
MWRLPIGNRTDVLSGAANDFPQDLLDAQRELHQTVAAYRAE